MTKQYRFAILGLAIFVLLWTIYRETYELTAVVVLGILLLIWSHFKQGTVLAASKAYQLKDYKRAESLLNEIVNPDRLAKNRRGFYEFMMGNIALQKENFKAAERHFQIASRFPLRNQNDKGIILVQLANLSLKKKELDRTRAYIEAAKALKVSARVQNIIEKIEKEIPVVT
ncbi:hypothetical protein GS399_17145 [Pedobacter sp. HMF7647]|uniref:Tetratricopeptide repeat protein n=1 Tax=Hufsiella arboris TaxID=2695275 RepID=A0A7K1YDP3_9SPHI|nr:hypothetical protein [Hufsiella arboris]MXV52702.1 hypothetical protein [Hufsiella arboris]